MNTLLWCRERQRLSLHHPEDLAEANVRRAEHDHIKGWEQTEDQREHELHADFLGALLSQLAPFRAADVCMRSQGVRDARAKSVGLHEHGDQRSNVIDLGAVRERSKRLEPRFTRSGL